MPLLLNTEGTWVGTPGRLLNAKSANGPVALDDTVVLVRDSNPVYIDALANDINPAGGPLTLVSAFAALGSASAQPDDMIVLNRPGFAGDC